MFPYFFHSRSLTTLSAALALVACSSPPMDGSSALSKYAVLEAVDLALTRQDCAGAVAAITPLYNSGGSDNEVRLKAAAAYGCSASINFFPLISNLAARGPTMLGGAGLWSSMAELFPSTTGSDYVVEGAEYGTDALQSMLNPGALVLLGNQVNPGTYNTGSVFATDRTSDSNLYLIFMSMAGIGGIQNRVGAPDPTTHIGDLPAAWTGYASMTSESDSCAYASFVLNMVDAMAAAQDSVASLEGSFSTVISNFGSLLDAACEVGCTGANDAAVTAFAPLLNDAAAWTPTGCTLALGACSGCPDSLRDRRNCTAEATDPASCAAAGIANFMNASSLGWN